MTSDYTRENWHWRHEPLSPRPAVIFDIDGVLADAAGRQHFLDWGDWKSFFDACGDDPIIEEIERLLELLDKDLSIILLINRQNTGLLDNGDYYNVNQVRLQIFNIVMRYL